MANPISHSSRLILHLFLSTLVLVPDLNRIESAEPQRRLESLYHQTHWFTQTHQAFRNSSVLMTKPAKKAVFRPIKSPNLSVRMAYKGQSSLGITAILVLYSYQACKTLFRPIKPPNSSVRMAYKGQSSFGITAILVLYTYRACKTLFSPIKPTNPSVQMAYKGQSSFRKSDTLEKYAFSTSTNSSYIIIKMQTWCYPSNDPTLTVYLVKSFIIFNGF